MNTTMPRIPMPANMNHCIAYQKCGPLDSSGSTIGSNPPDWAGVTSVALMKPFAIG